MHRSRAKPIQAVAVLLIVAGAGAGALASGASGSQPAPAAAIACTDESEAAAPGGSLLPSAAPCDTPELTSPGPGASVSPSASPIDAGAVGEVLVDARDLAFTPDVVTIRTGGSTTITLRDVGIMPHNLTVDELGIQVVAPAGRTSTATVIDPPPGTYRFYCSISGHAQAGMVGTLVVE